MWCGVCGVLVLVTWVCSCICGVCLVFGVCVPGSCTDWSQG
ncbi:membrane protein [Mycobacterium phage Reindeer]|uniref:Membrane protein n=1 Tax=Mycobacterium phage Reindeer TaxID=2762283 RepID=A0A7G8LI78_9CAUD|nr:membrane protein [Mycobacterium phage Reindeer]QNJ56950.1 membrane protein [Mycobacterium phage Reindeer]